MTQQVGAREVIQGWDLGILGTSDGAIPPMKEGGKRRLVIPSGAMGDDDDGGGLPAIHFVDDATQNWHMESEVQGVG